MEKHMKTVNTKLKHYEHEMKSMDFNGYHKFDQI